MGGVADGPGHGDVAVDSPGAKVQNAAPELLYPGTLVLATQTQLLSIVNINVNIFV